MRRGPTCRQPDQRQTNWSGSIAGIMAILSLGSVWGTGVCRGAAAFAAERPAAASVLHRSHATTRCRLLAGGAASASTLLSRFSIRAVSSIPATSTSLESPQQPSASSSSSFTSGAATAPVELAHVEFGGDGAMEASGPAPPVLLLHGLLGNKRNFATIATSLARQLDRKRRLFGLDLRNHGTSPSWLRIPLCQTLAKVSSTTQSQ
jgi:alpha/beta hydrolase fold